MKRILHVMSSVLGSESYSIRLGNAIVQKAIEKYPGSAVEAIDLVAMNLPHLNPAIFKSMFMPGELTAEAKETRRYSDEAVQKVMAADIIVIGAPLYNFTIPSPLKSWIDFITRPGVTFGYNEKGPFGLITGKKVYVAMSSGGVYSEGPGKANDFVAPYLKAFLGFLGMTDLTVFRAEGLKVQGIMEQGLEKGIASIAID